ncbi:hypothetical protein CBER1_08970 [Cercospora berteroae]|uniref:AMMECR1 domain-containing protein n=1 Tax=Cercospora berteroae TaxID=357750 RepID=A0A2S6C5E2_9PEZI|nr:hypothetical protein CBER1_08970 [Cercospora berteroae]
MATQAHCAFCFDTLAASFERRKPLTLAQTEELWERYHASNDEEPSEVEDDDDAEMTDVDGDEAAPSATKRTAISRLLDREPPKSAGSSSSSLPSAQSGSSGGSSKNASGTATPASSMSSATDVTGGARKGEEHPLFITWNTVSRSGHKSLRGCIGTFEAQELEYGLRSYALTSAFEDTRFSPIPSSLLPSLSCEVTLLTNFSSPSSDPLAWILGKHGIRISFTYHGRRYGATYLPSVAVEQEWTKEETLISLMRKAGYHGSSSSWERVWRDGRGELVTYEGKKVALGYKEWKEWRDWAEENR